IDNQVRSWRKIQVIGSFTAKPTDSIYRQGTYWGIRSHIADYGVPDALKCPADQSQALAETPTRLQRLGDASQEQLVNWGYPICDAAMRKHVQPSAAAGVFPYPARGIG